MSVNWVPGDETLPSDWKMRKDGNKFSIMSPEGKQYLNRAVALLDMIKRKYDKSRIDELFDKLEFEGWKSNQWLPDKWCYKSFEGKSSTKLERRWSFITREGLKLDNFKVVMGFMKQSEDYTSEDIEKVKKLKSLEAKGFRLDKYTWKKDDTSLPNGWKKRQSTNKDTLDVLLSPEGTQFRSRVSALKYMVKNGQSLDDIEIMKDKLVDEGWDTSDLLPDEWLYKKVWEGYNHHNIIIKYHYLADDGKLFENAKTALEYLQDNSVDYSQKDVENFQEFQNNLWNESLQSYQWIESDSIPIGWKMRVVGTDKEYFMNPDGRTFHTRFSAFQHMVNERYQVEEIKLIKSKLNHEGWKENSFLPTGWLYKLHQGNNPSTKKLWRSYRFISRENTILESIKLAVKFMKQNKYSHKITKTFRKLFKLERFRDRDTKKIVWNANDPNIPFGWKSRTCQNGSKKYLSPTNHQFSSFESAFKHMVNNNFLLSQVNVIKSYLVYEGWSPDVNLPCDWLVKNVGDNCYWFIGKYGEFLENAMRADEYIDTMEEYDKFDKENFRKIFGIVNLDMNMDKNQANSINENDDNKKLIKLKMKLDLMSHPGLPQGWQVRRVIDTSGESSGVEMEMFLTKEGVTIGGRRECWQYMSDHGYPAEDVEKIWKFSF